MGVGCVSSPPFWKAVADVSPPLQRLFLCRLVSVNLPLAELRSVKWNDSASVQAIKAAPTSTVLTKGAGFVFGDLG